MGRPNNEDAVDRRPRIPSHSRSHKLWRSCYPYLRARRQERCKMGNILVRALSYSYSAGYSNRKIPAKMAGFNRWRRQATREPRRKGTLLHCSGREVNGGCSEEALKVDVPHVVDRGSGTEPLRLLPYPLPPRAVYLVGSEDDPRAKQRDLLTRDSHPGCILCIAFAHFTRGDAAGGPLGLHRRPGLAISSTISQVVPHRWLGVGL